MPIGLQYYLLFGTSELTWSNYTEAALPSFGFFTGDGMVTQLGASGRIVKNWPDGSTSDSGPIPAFDPLQGAEPPTDVIALPYGHSGFLLQAIDLITQLLSGS